MPQLRKMKMENHDAGEICGDEYFLIVALHLIQQVIHQ